MKVTEAVEPDPEYAAVTFVLTVPCDVLVPNALTNEQLENPHDELGMLKY